MNTYNRVYIWCCKHGENRYCERCANKWWCASKHTGLLNSCLGKLHLLPYLVVPLISARAPLISTRVSAHCQAILLLSGECHGTPLMISQHCFRYWLGAIKHQAITLTNLDPKLFPCGITKLQWVDILNKMVHILQVKYSHAFNLYPLSAAYMHR